MASYTMLSIFTGGSNSRLVGYLQNHENYMKILSLNCCTITTTSSKYLLGSGLSMNVKFI